MENLVDQPIGYEIPVIRINRYFTEHGLISRREADRAITSGRVAINDRIAVLGDKVRPDDVVKLDGKVVVPAKAPVILAYHKPVGIECTTDQRVAENIIDAVKYSQRIFPIGRLDKDSEGLILLTNIGDIVNKILRARFKHEKEYVVDTNYPVPDDAIEKLRLGIELEDGPTRPCLVTRLGSKRLKIILTEGRNRQIRRMIIAVGLRVVRLKRVRIMHVRLGALGQGRWRQLSKTETQQLFSQLEQCELRQGVLQ